MEEQKFLETKTKNNLNHYNRWGIIISSALVVITLIVSWVLWFTTFQVEFDEILAIFNKYITDRCVDFVIDFHILTIFILTFAVIILISTTIPFIFLKHKGFITLILGLFLLVITTSSLIGVGWYLYFDYSNYNDLFNYLFNIKPLLDVCFFLLPVIIIIINLFCLFIFSLWLIMGFLFNNKKATTNNSLLLNSDQNFVPPSANNKPALSLSPFTENPNTPINFNDQVDPAPASLHQPGINIVINNNNPTAQNPQQSVTPAPLNVPSHIISNQENNSGFATTANSRMLANTTNSDEKIWTPQQIEEVWNKAQIIKNYDPNLYRKDYAGALLFRHAFVNNVVLNDDPKSYNWTIVCQRPLTAGGKIELNNLQPLNNTNALTKANNYPKWKTAISYNGKENILKQKSWKDKK